MGWPKKESYCSGIPKPYTASIVDTRLPFLECSTREANDVAKDIVKLTPEKYRQLVAVQYLNASDFLYDGLKRQQGVNDFHFVATMRSFIEYTRRGIWFLAWANDDKLRQVQNLTFDKPGSPGL